MMMLQGSLLSVLVAATAFAHYGSASDVTTTNTRRRLAYELLAGFEPRTLITNEAAIDLDVQVLEDQLMKQQFEGFKSIYEKGGHSNSIARLTLINSPPPPVKEILVGTTVVGWTNSGDIAKGRLVEGVMWQDGAESVPVLVEYQAGQEQKNYLNCQVGGLVSINAANRDGCFAENGGIQILDLQHGVPAYHYNYTYDASRDNYNERTIQSFSIQAEETMYKCDNCPYDQYAKFVEYYGEYDYADKVVQAALEGTSTQFKNGNVDFTDLDGTSRGEGMKTAAKFMSIWMYIIRMMEYSLDQCAVECGKRCDDLPVRSWDAAAAFYIGSKEGDDGEGKGNLMFDMADRLCVIFKTCGKDGDNTNDMSAVNIEILKEFGTGQSSVLRRDCDATRRSKERIVHLMAVPLVQATIFMAYLREYFPADTEEVATVDKVTGATMAATVLPLVHDCDARDAEIIFGHLQLSEFSGEVDFLAVKHAFERSYSCMGISCDLIGGIWEENKYGTNASPCRRNENMEDRGSSGVLPLAIIGVLLLIALGVFLFRRSTQGKDSSFIEDIAAIENTSSMEVSPDEFSDVPTID